MTLENGVTNGENMKIGAIIQARMSSSRLPNKVLKSLPYGSNISVLQQVIRRVSKSKFIDEIVVATSDSNDDERIVDIAKLENVSYFRGSLYNVLDRFYNVASKFGFDLIIRITSDNPCIDSNVIDKVIQNHLDLNADYTSTALINSFPIGIGCEVINFDALAISYKNATESFEKEHVTPYIYKSHPDKFKINKYFEDENYSDLRITLDTYQDYSLLCTIFDNLYEQDNFFTLDDILNLFDRKPWIKYINDDIIQKKVFDNLEEELLELIHLCDVQDLYKAKEFIENHFGE